MNEAEWLEEVSFRNLVAFYEAELRRFHCGERLVRLLNNNQRMRLGHQGVLMGRGRYRHLSPRAIEVLNNGHK